MAIAEGTYEEDLHFTDEHDGLMLHGRCADKTVIEGVDAAGDAVWIRGELELRLRDLAISGPRYGLAVEGGTTFSPHVDAKRVAVRGTVAGGMVVVGSGARLELDDCVVEDTVGGSQPAWGRGIEVINGGRLTATDLVIRDVLHDGILVTGSTSRADLESTQVLGTRPHEEPGGTNGVQVHGGASLIADGLTIEDTVGVGLLVYNGGASVELRSSTIRGTRRRPEMLDGPGIVLLDGGSVVGIGLEIVANEGSGVLAGGGSATISLEDSRIADTLPREDGTDGRGITVIEGCRLDATRLEVSSNALVGLHGTGLGTELHLVDSVISSNRPDGTGDGGTGILVEDRAALYASGIDVLDNHLIGVGFQGAGTWGSIVDSTVRGTLPGADGDDGLGISVTLEATLQASHVQVEDNHSVGLGFFEGAQGDVVDVEVRGTRRAPAGVACHGVAVSSGSSMQAERLVVEDNTGVGIAGGEGATIGLVDSRVAHTQPYANGEYGRGIGTTEGSTLSVQGLQLEGNHEIGMVAVGQGATITGSDVEVLDTLALPSGEYGRGLGVAYGASMELEGVEVLRSTEVGVWASGPGTSLVLRDAVVEGTVSTGALSAGSGIAVSEGAAATLSDVRVADNDGPGLWVNAEASVVGEGVVSDGNGFAGAVVYASALTLQGGEMVNAVAAPGRPGGVGILARFVFVEPRLALDGVRFAGHRYGGLYLRGPGRYEVRGCTFEDSGSEAPSTAGGVFATEGVEAWHELGPPGSFSGLLIEDSSFSSLASDAIVLDRSSATVMGGTFSGLGGAQVLWQRCEGTEPPEVDGVAQTACTSTPRAVEPLLVFHVDTTEPLAEQ